MFWVLNCYDMCAYMKFLPDITGDLLLGKFDELINASVSTESRNPQDNKFVIVPASQGTGKTTLAFLLSRKRYVLFVDVSAGSGSFAIVRNILLR